LQASGGIVEFHPDPGQVRSAPLDPNGARCSSKILGCQDIESFSPDLEGRAVAVGGAGYLDLAAQVGQVAHFESLRLLRPNDHRRATGLDPQKGGLNEFNGVILRPMLHPLRGDLPGDPFAQTQSDQVKPFNKPIGSIRARPLRRGSMLLGGSLCEQTGHGRQYRQHANGGDHG
jgi:hypothetical protein